MKIGRPLAIVSILVLLGSGSGLATSAATPASAEEDGRDPRTVEVARLDCSRGGDRREITLFANGTVRLRSRGSLESMRLLELGPDETDDIVATLEEIDLGEVEEGRPVLRGGAWLETCRLRLERPGGEETLSFHFGRTDALPLALSRVVAVVDELGSRAEISRQESDFPVGYVPRAGDVVRRADGELFRVIAYTTDGNGVELQGVDQPLTLYMPHEEVAGAFVALEEQARPLGRP